MLKTNEQAEPKRFNLSGKDCEHPDLHSIEKIVFEVCPVDENFQLTLDDFAHLTADLSTRDHTQQQFIEIVTSQYAVRNP